MDYKKRVIKHVVKALCKRAGKVAAKAIFLEASSHAAKAEALRKLAEKLEYAAKVYAESNGAKDSDLGHEKGQKSAAWGTGAKFGDAGGRRQSRRQAQPTSSHNYSLADACEALRDQLPVEDKRLEAQGACLAALAALNDKNYAQAIEAVRGFAWENGRASTTAGLVASIIEDARRSAEAPTA